MFMPQRVLARDLLKGRADPAQAVTWQPHAVTISCDGNAGATTGAWQRGPAFGYFTTVRRRDPRKGEMRRVLAHGGDLPPPRAAPPVIESTTAEAGASPLPG